MKRLFTILTMVMLSVTAFADDNVNSIVLQSFKNNFASATEVEWTVKENYSKASFVMNGQYASAYYNNEGSLIALTRNISSSSLPITLQASLKQKQGEGMWISELFEVSNDEGTVYYVTLENGESRLVFKSTGSSWTSFQKQSKS